VKAESLEARSISHQATSYPVGSSAGKNIFKDLSTGTLFGTETVGTVSEHPVLVNLNAEGMLAMNKRLGNSVAMGGHLRGNTPADMLFGNSGVGGVTDVRLEFYYGPSTSLTLSGQRRVEPGTQVRFDGDLSSANPACEDTLSLDVTIGSLNRTVITGADGSFSFHARIARRTTVRAFYPGSASTPSCGGSDKRMTVRVRN